MSMTTKRAMESGALVPVERALTTSRRSGTIPCNGAGWLPEQTHQAWTLSRTAASTAAISSIGRAG